MSRLSSLLSISTKQKKRVGRGYGSGKGGHTSGRGTKGQKARRGVTIPLWFEGGQLPMTKRMPMLRGKGRLNVTTLTVAINLNDIEKMKSDTISLDTLKLEKVISPKAKRAKVVATGTLTKKVALKGILVSKAAKELIEKVGGTIE